MYGLRSYAQSHTHNVIWDKGRLKTSKRWVRVPTECSECLMVDVVCVCSVCVCVVFVVCMYVCVCVCKCVQCKCVQCVVCMCIMCV